MFEDDFYRSSSQYRHWSFTETSLQNLRATTNAHASERVRAALRRAREARQSASSSAAGTPTPTQAGSDADGKAGGADDKEIECLTPEEELQLVKYYCEQVILVGESYKPALPTIVRATAIQYLRRFYLTNSPMTYHPKNIMPCAVFLATKTDNCYISLRHFADGVPGDTTAEDIIAPEFVLMQSLRFNFDVRHPFRGLEGGIMELQSIAQGTGQPAPHLPQQTSDTLRRGLLAVPPTPGSSSSSITDRLGRAHTATRDLLKTAAQMTDAYFLYTPSQIWLAAFYLADRALAEFYLDTKLGPQTTDSDTNNNPLSELRAKIYRTLTNCASLLQSYKSLAEDPSQKATARRISKKLYHCQNPEKANNITSAGQKRIPAAAAAAAAAASAATASGDGGTSESDVERIAKKRKLEREQREKEGRDLFGGELVAQRTKD